MFTGNSSVWNSSLGIKAFNKIRRNFMKNFTTIVNIKERDSTWKSVLSSKELHKISYLCKYLSSLKGREIITIHPRTAYKKLL